MQERPVTSGVLETALYVDDVERSLTFYETIFGFRKISDFGDRGCAVSAGNPHVLLLFKKGASQGIQSPHDGDGELHIAFASTSDDLPKWEEWLTQHDIAIEERRTWEMGGQSIYFRDPDRHLLEFVTPGTWAIY